MKKDTYKLEIEKLDHFGRGMAKKDDLIFFVPKILTGDIALVKIYKQKKNIIEGKVIKYLSKQKQSICPYGNICGGCTFINLDYDSQIDYKVQRTKEVLYKFLSEDISINEVIKASQFNYRNKITLHIDNKKIGLYEEKSNRVIEIDKCYLVKISINKLISRLRVFIDKHNHNLTEVIIRTNSNGDSIIWFKGKVNKGLLKEKFSDLKSIILNDEIILGDGYIIENILDYKFRMSYKSFFQVNLEVIEKIIISIKKLLKDNYENTLDLYCGTGTIGIMLSNKVNKMTGIEIEEEAIKDANYNKKLNNIKNINFICNSINKEIDNFKNIDLIIVDPPRSGLDSKTREAILEINPRDIIYISCNQTTLGRDLSILKENYKIKKIILADMFPNTYHCETVCLLKRKNK